MVSVSIVTGNRKCTRFSCQNKIERNGVYIVSSEENFLRFVSFPFNFCATLSITIVIAFVFTTFYREINCNFILFLYFFSRGSLRAFSDAADPR